MNLYDKARGQDRGNRLINASHYGVERDYSCEECNDGEDHRWQPVSFRFETQVLDDHGRVQIRQPDMHEANVYMVCLGCNSWTYVVTEFVGYFLGGPGDGHAGPDPVLSILDEAEGKE